MDESLLLQHVIQLVVLCIPLFALPLILKSSNTLLNKVSGATDAFNRKIGLDRGLEKGRTGIKDAAKKRAKFAAGNMAGRFEEGGRFKGTLAGKTFRGGQTGLRKRAGNKRAREMAIDSRKEEREAAVRSLAGDAIVKEGSRFGEALQRTGGAKMSGYAARINKEEFEKIVGGIKAEFEMTGANAETIGKRLKDAIGSGDAATATAAIDRLSNMGGYGINQIGETLSEAAPQDDDVKQAVLNAVNDRNYGNIVERAADIARGDYDTSGQFVGGGVDETGQAKGSLKGLSAAQLASQTDASLHRGIADGSITHEQAKFILDPANNLVNKTHSEDARATLTKLADGSYSPPAAPKATQKPFGH